MKNIRYRHVDVFSKAPLSGNGLTVFMDCQNFSTELMQKLTQEMRQYESIFLSATVEPHRFHARIFTMEEELDFAGHPILGAACVLHEREGGESPEQEWIIELKSKEVVVRTQRTGTTYEAIMDQGQPVFNPPVKGTHLHEFLRALNLSPLDVAEGLPLQVVSTGLPNLIVPIQQGLERVRIVATNFAEMLEKIGAKFAYILDVGRLEARTWDNDGRVEDIATGSAAGAAGAYLVAHGIRSAEEDMIIHQGRFVGRPSELRVRVSGSSVKVSGGVCMVSTGVFD